MAKTFYCSKCGQELGYFRRAVPKKGIILDLIEPHDCEGYAIKANEGEKPTVLDIINSLKDISFSISSSTPFEPNIKDSHFEDLRDGKKTTSAPRGILQQIKTGIPSGSVGEDPDETFDETED